MNVILSSFLSYWLTLKGKKECVNTFYPGARTQLHQWREENSRDTSHALLEVLKVIFLWAKHSVSFFCCHYGSSYHFQFFKISLWKLSSQKKCLNFFPSQEVVWLGGIYHPPPPPPSLIDKHAGRGGGVGYWRRSQPHGSHKRMTNNQDRVLFVDREVIKNNVFF